MRIISLNSFLFSLLFLLTRFGDLCSCRNSTLKCNEQERQALLNLKKSIQTFDPSSPILPSWKGYDCCNWEGIACNNVTGHVIKLDLNNHATCPLFEDNFEAYSTSCDDSYALDHINSSLLHLQHLIHLDLSGVLISGSPIPKFIGSMQQLRYLSLTTDFQGDVPSTLGNLTNLHALHINSLYGAYSVDISWLAQLSSLEYFSMSGVVIHNSHNLFQALNMIPSLLQINLFLCGLGNKQTIPIHHPINLSNLTKVQVVNIALNDFQDPFLDAFRNLTSIRVLDISYNKFTSLPQWFDKFNNLVVLYLSGNRFSGQSLSVFQNNTSIRELDLTNTNLCSVPSWLSKFKSLIKLGLAENYLHGSTLYTLQNLTSLKGLDLSDNKLASIPLWLGELKNLIHLFLEDNGFTTIEGGSLSPILRNLCHLKEFYLYGYKLQGKVFYSSPNNISLCNSYDLEVLDLGNNNFSDSLPSWLGHFRNLDYLNLCSNSFFGPIPDSLGELVNLVTMDLSSNSFSGVIPWNLGKLVNLEILNISSNSFIGVIPESLGQLKKVTVMILANNHLHGNIPHSLGQVKSLYYLDLSFNSLEGPITPINISILLLSNNHINGSIPSSLCRIKTLKSLDVSSNNLSGKIPDCWRNSSSVDNLDLSSNRLSGLIPSSIGNISRLVWLHLNNNSLQGEIPWSLANLKHLLILDLGENQLSGAIPSWKGSKFTKLQILRLHGNMFNGIIPSSLCKFSKLKILDLANNNFRGSIPHCIGNFTGMVLEQKEIKNLTRDKLSGNGSLVSSKTWNQEDVKQVIKGRELDYTANLVLLTNLDLSNNRLDGSIPEGISSLTGLLGLNLSYNNFSGEIPEMIGNMKSLESIDFSHNHLFGAIPSSMSTLNFLSHLNLSENNFSGPIPKGNQFQVLNDPLIYNGNPYLCGDPLTKICPGDDSHQVPHSGGYEDEGGENDESDKVWFYFVIALGFATGFWGVIGVFLVKKNWRHACFRYVDEVADRLYVATVLKVAKLKSMLQWKC